VTNADVTSERDRRDAAVAAVLARAVRAGEVHAADALRIVKHEMRRRNTNRKLKIVRRSVAAQAVVDKYERLGQPPPNNNSPEALHADHVHSFTERQLREIDGVDAWVEELRRLREVVCVTAAENYRLEQLERAGVTGEDKYERAEITWASQVRFGTEPISPAGLEP